MIKSIILICVISTTFALTGDSDNLVARSNENTKISSALSNALRTENAETQSLTSEATGNLSISRDAINFDDEGEAQVYITLYELNQQNLETLKSEGVNIEIYDESLNLVQGRVKPDGLDNISDLSFVKFIDLPNYGYVNPGSVQTEGDAVLRADEARETFGVDGTGVKVGVISNGINGLTESLGSGDLPSGGINIPSSPLIGGGISIDDPCPGFSPVMSTPGAGTYATRGAEGTAMAEIIHDIAPGAELYFAPVLFTSLELRRSIRCITEVVAIIADDIIIFNDGAYDGTSPVSLESAASVQAGVTNFISVGNQALDHFQGIFTDTDNDAFHEFDVSLGMPFMDNSGETLNITIPPEMAVRIYLQWNDPFGDSGNDYDLIMIVPADPSSPVEFTSLVSSSISFSDDRQDGDDNPTELIAVVNNGSDPVTAGIVIVDRLKFFGLANAEPRLIDMFVVGIPDIPGLDEFQVPQSSVPNNSDADLVLSIGSVASGAGDPLEQSQNQIRSYSSRGPTNDGRIKPELVAPDGVSITGAGGFPVPFFGTSAAAPHAAGVAALLLEAEENSAVAKSGSVLLHQKLSPSEVSDILRSTAVDLGAPGADNTFGSGRIDAFAAVQSVVQAPPTPTQTPSPTPTPTPPPTVSPASPPTGGGGGGSSSSSGGCTVAGPVQIETALANILIPLVPAFAIGVSITRRRRKKTI